MEHLVLVGYWTMMRLCAIWFRRTLALDVAREGTMETVDGFVLKNLLTDSRIIFIYRDVWAHRRFGAMAFDRAVYWTYATVYILVDKIMTTEVLRTRILWKFRAFWQDRTKATNVAFGRTAVSMYVCVVIVVATDVFILRIGLHGRTLWRWRTVADPLTFVGASFAPDSFISIDVFTQSCICFLDFRTLGQWWTRARHAAFHRTLLVIDLFVGVAKATKVFQAFILLE